MHKNYIWGGLALVGIAAAIWVFVVNGTKTETPLEDDMTQSGQQTTNGNDQNTNGQVPSTNDQSLVTNQKVTVIYNGTSFSPQTVTVKKGTTVAFANTSSRGMWVGSDPHPEHTDLSSFDSRRAYSQGQTYEYTFNEAGTWEYHNHVNSGQRGTVIVE